ncbi:MAG: alpha/beta hydrolase, partial [Pirellula sp.]
MKKIILLVVLSGFEFLFRPAFAQDTTSPILRFGIEVADDPFGVRIVEIQPTRPISTKLREGDVLVSFVVSDDIQKTRIRIGNVDAIDGLKETIANGRSVEVTVLRPDAEPGKYRQIVVQIDAIDLLRSPVVMKEMTSSVEVPYCTTVPTFAANEGSAVRVSVFYGTDRKLDGNNQYSGDRDREETPLKFGVCQVTIPPDHRYGQLEGPKFWKLEFSADPRKHVFLANVSQIGKENTLAAISEHFHALPDQSKRRLLVFVHGYNVSFADAARRSAQMHYDLNFPGVSAFYSWPSNATLSGYVSDAEDISWSTPHIQEFLETLDEKSDVDEIYLLAHSMGNRGVSQALLSMEGKG